MKARTAVLGVTAGCAACCSVPLITAMIASAGLAGVGSAWLGWGFGLALIAAAFAAFAFLRRRPIAAACRSEDCGCGPLSPSQKDTAASADDGAVIACSLAANDFKQRSAWIHELARKHLRRSRRTPLTLDLTYEAQAAEQVREMVAKEQTCCSFLRFDLQEKPDAVRLTITAPEKAREAADVLFDHFAPASVARPTSDTREGVFA